MSHLRPESRRHKIAQCRRGRHLYGPSQRIGAGIERQVCEVCQAVSIDLTNADQPESPVLVHRPSYSELKR